MRPAKRCFAPLPATPTGGWQDAFPTGGWERQKHNSGKVNYFFAMNPSRLSAEVADISIPLARNGNSAMTMTGAPRRTDGRGWIVPVGSSTPDRRRPGADLPSSCLSSGRTHDSACPQAATPDGGENTPNYASRLRTGGTREFESEMESTPMESKPLNPGADLSARTFSAKYAIMDFPKSKGDPPTC